MSEWSELAQLRSAALTDFTRRGLPSRRDEAWKYTSTTAFAQQQFTPSTLHQAGLGVETTLPPGVIVSSWADALPLHAERIMPYLDKLVVRSHGFQAQNTALFQDGLFIYIPEGVQLESPLWLVPSTIATQTARFVRYLIVTEADSAVNVIEDYTGDTASAYFTNTLTELLVGPRARVQHYKLQRESLSAYHVGHFSAKLLADSELNCHSMSLGGQWVRSDTTIEFAEPGAQCRLNGIYLTSGTQHVDHHTVVEHQVPHCSSTQDYRGILSGRSRAVFNGNVRVAADAQRSCAKQQNKNILLSAQAEIDTKPQLEIFANDVQCAHGATVGQLSEDALFYFMTRGIPLHEARQLLLDAFVMDNVNQLVLPALVDKVSTLIQQREW